MIPMNHKQHNEIMKKKYLEPASVVVNLSIDSHLMTSSGGSSIKIVSNSDDNTAGSEALTQHETWNSGLWSKGNK